MAGVIEVWPLYQLRRMELPNTREMILILF